MRIMSNISLPQAQAWNDICFLIGKDHRSEIQSWHSFSDGSRIAVQWLKVHFKETGADCKLCSFWDGLVLNVIWYIPTFLFLHAHCLHKLCKDCTCAGLAAALLPPFLLPPLL